MDWDPPCVRNIGKLKVLLKCIKIYLSRGNIEAPLDQYIEVNEGPDAGNKEM